MALIGDREHRGAWLLLATMIGCGWLSTGVRAQETGFEAAVRVGYGLPVGPVTGPGGDLSEGIAGQIPLALDIGYRVIPNVFVGVYAQYGFGFVGSRISDACDVSSEVSCSAHDIRLGLEGQYHIAPGKQFDPWVGLGFGYEWMSMGVEATGNKLSMTPSGFELFNLQAGLDIAAAEHFYIGPFLSIAFAQYSNVSVNCSAALANLCSDFGADGDIPDKAVHEWVMFGVRGAYAP